MQSVRTGPGGFVGLDVLVTDDLGNARPCSDGQLSVSVEVSEDGGESFTVVDSSSVTLQCTPAGQGDLALVVDNSGSQFRSLEMLREAAHNVAGKVLPAGGRVSVTRVSTQSRTLQPLTDDASAVGDAIDSMFVNDGWTALYDGIRMANETLGGELRPVDEGQVYDGAQSFCTASRRLGIVAFTDGQDNNSADEQNDSYDPNRFPGDGIDTTVEDLLSLRVDSITTPIYTVGLGDTPSHGDLSELARASGGTHTRLDSVEDLPGVFDRIGEYFGSAHQVCADLPLRTCGELTMRVSYDWTDGVETTSGVREAVINVPCSTEPRGRTATVLMTMNDPGIPVDTATALVEQTVSWVSPETAPRVLVVRDDNNRGEQAADSDFVLARLRIAGFDADLMEEPADGITMADADGYDVVWLSNPGYPVDDRQTYETLLQASEAGLGVVMQGDDISRFHGNSFSMAPLTGLRYINNGVRTCGQRTDNRAGRRHEVTINGSGHPLTAGLDNSIVYYGDDIDETAVEAVGSTVLATATLEGGGCDTVKPVIIATDRLVD